MNSWKSTCISPTASIQDAIRKIDESALQIALVVEGERLRGTVTDGDIRRAILKGVSLQDPVQDSMNAHPAVAALGDDRQEVVGRMRRAQIRHMPVVDASGLLVGMEILDELLAPRMRSNPVLLMAGGMGKRLSPLTEDCPKPMLQVGGRPILETILLNFSDYGFRRFYLSVNYKAEVIVEYFGDGSRWGVQIEYLREDERLGTAGALALLPERPVAPMLVMNGDVLTRVNMNHLLDFHVAQRAQATMCILEYQYQVPFGVVRVDGQEILSIDEKPTQKFFVNAGIYTLEPEVIDLVPRKSFFDITTLFGKLVEQGRKTAVFPLREYWLDVGQHADFEKAKVEFEQIFHIS
jgi:dTDP-glucose pyrophosphorylase